MGNKASSQSSLGPSESDGGGGGGPIEIDTKSVSSSDGTQTSNGENDISIGKEAAVAPSQQPKSTIYTPPSGPIQPLAHYIFLVHGWLGNDLEMGYLSCAFRKVICPSSDIDTENEDDTNPRDSVGLPDAKRAKRSGSRLTQVLLAQQRASSAAEAEDEGASEATSTAAEKVTIPEIIVHSVKCNVGKTNDGIRNGGTRLANEIIDFIRKDVQERIAKDDTTKEQDELNITYSLVGNSLGGLYARYAISLLPYQLSLNFPQSPSTKLLNIHPNIFCTTATPHLGVSRHTYLPIPRIAETIIGTGMGTTGRDLFRLNTEKDLASAAAGNLVNVAIGGVKRLSALRQHKSEGNLAANGENNEDGNDVTNNTAGDNTNNGMVLKDNDEDDPKDLECIIRNMCLQEKYLSPLRNFRQRIAYANAYGTDFQVPTETAAFLNEKSGVGHFVIASRHLSSSVEEKEGGEKDSAKEDGLTDNGNADMEETARSNKGEGGGGQQQQQEEETVPSFIVAVCRTEQTPQPQTPRSKQNGNGRNTPPNDELIQMSQSLDALGWTKVFIDVRDRIPVPGLAKPSWLRPPCGSLDDLIRDRTGLQFSSCPPSSNGKAKKDDGGDDCSVGKDDADATTTTTTTTQSSTTPTICTVATTPEEQCILTSQELALSTHAGDSINFPLGHTVMVANSKSERYSQLNSKGRPVMDKLAEDMVDDVLGFE
eukprot:CAMPEP_0183719668 /NCGR_PEP_ID=MMETSP0737-20130205/12502_1 /TAXON_ID=385413 /ORGANISM="Thalassiosira miniscula, Strain CCMP1093" /LENGTH=708 /DNA_ID=CAMNT_0025949399 /DNA_START=368 /DNA_END=2494 /DNA_ORIENTATION=+